MKDLRHLQLGIMLVVALVSGNGMAESTSQYNMSLQDKVITGPKGSLTSPQAASANKRAQIEEKSVRKIADGIYRIGGWGIGNIIAVEAPEGWVVVDTGDYLKVDVRALGLCLLAYTSLIPIRFGRDHLQPRRI